MSKSSNKKKSSKIGILFWIIFASVIVICFFVSKNKISKVLQETEFIPNVIGEKDTVITDIMQNKKDNEQQDLSNLVEPIKQSRNESELVEKDEVKETVKKVEKKIDKKSEVEENDAKPIVKKMKLNLCFVVIDSDGKVDRKEVIRELEKNNSPLTTAINCLLAGPSSSDNNFISLIPEGTKLINASVNNKTAILNFNEAFSFNKYGVQGYLGQLMQIVYTATSFATIDNVQFLIEGQKIEYLGGEGVWIGSPLTRMSFK